MFNKIANLNPRNRFIFDLSIILSVSILVVLPLFINGIPEMMDLPQQYQFAQNYYDSFLNGNFYPGWANNPNYGYGDVGIRFYPPLAYFIIGFFRWVAGNWFDASCLFFVFLYFLSGTGVYLWAREKFSEKASLIGAIVYILLPYHIQQIYIGTLLGESTAAALLPFCFLFLSRVANKGKAIDICGLGIFYGLLILSHIPSTLTSSLTLFVFALFSLKKTNLIQTGLKMGAGVGLGILLSSFYWLRMIAELNFVKHNSEAYYTGIYSYKTQFVFSYLFPFSGVSSSSPYALMNLIGLMTLGVLIPCAILYYLNAKKKNLPSIINVTAATAFALFMAMPFSVFVWQIIPTLQKIQFPFRWLTLVTLGTAFLVAAAFDLIIENLKTPQRYLSILAIGLFMICPFYSYFNFMNPYYPLDRDYLNSLMKVFRTMPSYECWWAAWTVKSTTNKLNVSRPYPELIENKVVIKNRSFTLGEWLATERTFTIAPGEAGQAEIATQYYPHWKAEVNGQSVEVTPTPTGLISFPVPVEESQVKLYFQEPVRVVTAYYLSGAAWLSIFVFLLFCASQSFRKTADNPLNAE